MVGRFIQADFDFGVRFCRVGALANSLRQAVATLRINGVPESECGRDPAAWANALPNLTSITPEACAAAAALALPRSIADWGTEVTIFGAGPGAMSLQEDWPDTFWEDQSYQRLDPRSAALCSPVPLCQGCDWGLYFDGGFDLRHGATFAAQAWSFGRDAEYWESSHAVSDVISGRLPRRYGHDGGHDSYGRTGTAALRQFCDSYGRNVFCFATHTVLLMMSAKRLISGKRP